MTHLTFLTGLAGAGVCLTACANNPGGRNAADQKPNVLIIYSDDMGVGDLSLLNDGWIRTPNLDRLASQGLTVDNYYTSSPISSPSRVGLTTGMYPLRWGLYSYLSGRDHNRQHGQNDFLDPQAPTMAGMFHAAGYATAHIGKWHMGGGRDVTDAPSITRYGFDEYVSTWESPDPEPAITGDPTWIWSDRDSVQRWDRSKYFVDRTLDFLKRHKGKPCFVNLWPDDVHTPWVPDAESLDKNNTWDTKANFIPVMEEYDRQIGRLMEGLKELGLEENTIVIFTSDNGPAPTFKQQRTNMMRGAKAGLYEGGIRMPFIIRWPGRTPAGKVDHKSIVGAVDLVPSLCAMAGVAMPDGYHSDGEDRSGVLKGKNSNRKTDLMWEFGRSSEYAKPANANHSPHLAIRRGDWKLLVNSDDGGARTELYNLKDDIRETTNLAERHPELVSELRGLLMDFWGSRAERKE